MKTATEDSAVEKPIVPDVDLCVVHSYAGKRIDPALAGLLDPVNPGSFHQYTLPARELVELHYHDVDEYWWFTSGNPVVTLWSPASGLRGVPAAARRPRGGSAGRGPHTLGGSHPRVLSVLQLPAARDPAWASGGRLAAV